MPGPFPRSGTLSGSGCPMLYVYASVRSAQSRYYTRGPSLNLRAWAITCTADKQGARKLDPALLSVPARDGNMVRGAGQP